jgi:isoquinoline 1-oxidoreductase subunit alpha
MISFKTNGRSVSVNVPPDTPLLWVLREELQLPGAKFGCGRGLCGACTVHLDGVATRSCVLPVGAVQGRRVTTVEGLGDGRGGLHPVQQAWIDLNVTQCGYCQSGQLMTAAAYVDQGGAATDAEVRGAMNGNLCRCGTYQRVVAAVQVAASAPRQTPIKVQA